MRRLILTCAALVALSAAPALAQQPSGPESRREELRRRLEERFALRVQEELGLSNDQMSRLRSTSREFAGRRRQLEAQQRDLHRALGGQMRPGVAADKDSVAKLTDGLVDLRVDYARTLKDEMAELRKFLDPVQRAKLLMVRERLIERVQTLRERQEGGEFFRGRRAGRCWNVEGSRSRPESGAVIPSEARDLLIRPGTPRRSDMSEQDPSTLRSSG
jgi:hypothetical protein